MTQLESCIYLIIQRFVTEHSCCLIDRSFLECNIIKLEHSSMDTILEVYYINFFSELVHSVLKLHEILIKTQRSALPST